MELYQLRSFITVAKTGNLTLASEHLFTSQPAVSAHIKALEEELDIQLFKRTPKGMVLTDNGVILKAKALEVLESSQSLKVQASLLKGELSGVIKIGLNADADYLKLSHWHQYLLEHYPKITVELVQETSVKLEKLIDADELDASFLAIEPTRTSINSIRLHNGYAIVAAASKWKEKMNNASLADLSKLPWIQPESYCIYHHFINELFNNNKPNNITISSSEEFTLNLLLSGTGLSFIRDDQVNELLKSDGIATWDKVTFPLPLNFAYKAKRESDPLIQCLLDIIPQFFHAEDMLIHNKHAS